MTNIKEQAVAKNPMDEVYAIRQMISRQYGPSVRAISKGILKEQPEAEKEGFVFIDLPQVRHQEMLAALANI